MAERAYLKVDLIGQTSTTGLADRFITQDTMNVEDPDHLAEMAGRLCYQSWDKPNPSTRENANYVANILRQHHLSVVAHSSIVVYIEGISRSLTHELIRSRFPTFSELSQRYVEASDFRYVVPPAFEPFPLMVEQLADNFHQAIDSYQHYLTDLGENGIRGKKAKQAARAILPNCTETKMIMGINLRAVRDLCKQRITPHADEEIYRFSCRLLEIAKEYAPSTFSDMSTESLYESNH